MKKKFIITIILLCVATISIGAAFAFGLQENRIEYEQETLFGDPSYADGITASYQMTSSRSANWLLAYKLNKTGFEVEDDFKHSPSINLRDVFYKEGSIYDDENINDGRHITVFRGFNTSTLEDKFREEFKKENITGEMVKRVYLKDIQKYYEPDLSISANNMSIYGTNSSFPEAIASGEQAFWNKFYDYFKIPVIDNETLLVTGVKVKSNDSIACFVNNDYEADMFDFYVKSVLSDDALYFNILNRISIPFESERKSDDIYADFSQVPGGYGIYKLPYDKEKDIDPSFQEGVFDIDNLQTIFSLNENEQVGNMGLSSDGSHLYLIINEEAAGKDRLVFKSINLKTFNKDQEIVIEEDAAYSFVIQKSNFVAIRAYGNNLSYDHLKVIYERSGGKYELIFDTDLGPDEASLWNVYSPSIACDGDKFVVSNMRMQSGGNNYYSTLDASTGIDITVYQGNKLKYYGRYTNSLDLCNIYNAYVVNEISQYSHSSALMQYIMGSNETDISLFNIRNSFYKIDLSIDKH